MIQDQAIKRVAAEEAEVSVCLKVNLAILMGLLTFISLVSLFWSGPTFARFSNIDSDSQVLYHLTIGSFHLLVLAYGIYGFATALMGSRSLMRLLYLFTIFIVFVCLLLIVYSCIHCGGFACDSRKHFEELFSMSKGGLGDKSLWRNVEINFSCCGLDGPEDYEIHKKPKPASCSSTDDMLVTAIGHRGCVKVANYFDSVNRGGLVAEAIILSVVVCLLLNHYINSNSTDSIPSYYQPGMLMAGNPMISPPLMAPQQQHQQQQPQQQQQQQPELQASLDGSSPGMSQLMSVPNVASKQTNSPSSPKQVRVEKLTQIPAPSSVTRGASQSLKLPLLVLPSERQQQQPQVSNPQQKPIYQQQQQE